MGVRYYDTAIYEKIKAWVRDERMRILKPNESMRVFQLAADLSDDTPITLPLISISRDTNVEILSTGKRAMSFDGLMVKSDGKKTHQINAIPIRLRYQIDIYTKEFEMGDEYVRNFIFNLINHPKLTVTIPYNNLNYHHDCNITLDSTVQDNSDIPQRMFAGQFTRWTISFSVDDAYMFSAPIENNVSMEAEATVEV